MTRDRKHGIRWRLWLTICVWIAVLLSTALAVRRVHHFMLSDARFRLADPEDPGAGLAMRGLVHTSRYAVLRTFTPDFGRSIFSIPIHERRRRLLAVGWVADASVSRLWPNRVLVEIRERTPVAFVNVPVPGSRGSRVLLIDKEGVLLEQPPQAKFTFPILNGITEEQTEIERQPRVHAMMRLMEDLGPLSREVSEIDASSPENLKMIAQADGRAVELTLGDRNFARRYENFLNHYSEIRRHAANVTAFDLRLDDRITAAGAQ